MERWESRHLGVVREECRWCVWGVVCVHGVACGRGVGEAVRVVLCVTWGRLWMVGCAELGRDGMRSGSGRVLVLGGRGLAAWGRDWEG